MNAFAKTIVSLAVCCIALASAGCVAIPAEELAQYREAFVQAQNAGDILYDELSIVIERQTGKAASSSCASVNGLPPRCFDPNQSIAGGSSRDPAVQARLVALRTIATYNLAIADLVEGKSASELQARVTELAGLVSDFAVLASISSGGLPALVTGPVLATFKQLATRLENARANAVARQSLLADSGIVDQLIDLLIADTSKMYDVYFIGQASFARKQPTAEAQQREFAKVGAFHESLTAYVKLLRQTKDGLAQLRIAATGAAGGVANTRAVIAEAIEIRAAAEAFWDAVRELRN